jgi:hypothetical protein
MATTYRTARFLAEESGEGEKYEHLGCKVILALLSQPRWITRTVESVRFVDRNVVSRRVVRHFVIPKDKNARPQIGKRYAMPVYAVRKGQFISCDLVDGSGRSVSLAPLQDRCKLSYLALLNLVRQAGIEEDTALYGQLWRIVESPQTSDIDGFRRLLEQSPAGRVLLDSEMFKLVEFLARNYLIYRVIPKDNVSQEQVLTMRLERRVPDSRADFKMAGEDPPAIELQTRRWLGLASHEFRHEFIQTAGSTHIEVEAPDGIAIGHRVLDYLGVTKPAFVKPVLASLSSRGTSKRRARVLVPRTAPLGAYAVTVNLRPGAGVMRDAGQAIAGLLALLTFIVAARRSHITDASLIDAAATLLLVLPGLVALTAARPAEHPRVSRVMVGPRALTISIIPLSAIAAVTLITGWPTCVLWVIGGFAALLSFLLFFSFMSARRATMMDVVDAVAAVSTNEDHQVLPASIQETNPPIILPPLTRIG